MEQTKKADGSILLEILKDQSRLVTDGIEPKYLSDTLGRLTGNADALVFPVSTEEVSAILRYAHDNHIPVTPRGREPILSALPNAGYLPKCRDDLDSPIYLP